MRSDNGCNNQSRAITVFRIGRKNMQRRQAQGQAAERHDEGQSSASRVRTMPIGLGILAVMIFIPSPQLGLRSAERA